MTTESHKLMEVQSDANLLLYFYSSRLSNS